MKKTVTVILLMLFTFSNYAQTDLYTALVNNGLNTKYTEYSTNLKEDGTCQLTSYFNDKFVLELEQIPSGEHVGFSLLWEVEPTNGGSYRAGESTLSDYGRAPNYPDVSYIHHTYRKDGYVALDGNIYKLEGISKDGLSFEKITKVYMPVKTEKTGEEDKTDKKKSFKDRLNSIKDAYVANSGGEGALSKEARQLQEVDLKTKITDYLKAMKTKHDAHATAPEVVQAQKNIENARQGKADEISAANDAIKRGPQYQKTLQNNANAQSAKDRKEFIRVEGTDAKVDNCKYYIKNEGSITFYYINSSQKKGSIAPGATQEFSCYYMAFFAEGENKGKVIGGGGQRSRDRTYTVK